MEVRIEPEQDQILPKDLFLSVRLGSCQKQARFSGSRVLNFPDPGDNSDGSQLVGRVEIFQRIGFASVDFSNSHNGQLQNYNVDCGALDFSPLKLRMSMSYAGNDNPLDETFKSASEQKVRQRLDAAQRYMKEHQLDELLAESLREVIRERPSNPHCFLSAEIVKRGAKLPPISSPLSPMASKIKDPSSTSQMVANCSEARKVVNDAYIAAHKTLALSDALYLDYVHDDYFRSYVAEAGQPGQSEERPLCTFTYIGEWQGGSRVGEGTQVFPNGSKYEGEWLNDRAGGKGKFTHADGAVYEGEWSNGKANGEGTFTHINGTTYKGQWKDDTKNGTGVEEWTSGAKYQGQFTTDAISGKGIFSWDDGSSYNGEFVDHAIQGKGTYSWSDGRKYTGEWADNQMHGKGFFTWTDGRTFEGEYMNDVRHGSGILKWSDGRVYEGSWVDGIEHGAGVYTLASGENFTGRWEAGEWKWD